MAYTTINKSTDYFNTKLYSGTGSSQALTGVGFQPDWTWIKQRSGTQEHWLVDAVRGTTKFLESNSTNVESSDGATGFTSFDSDGFTVNTSARTNQSSNTYASWNWKAGTTGSGNTGGSGTYKTYNYSVNTTGGFSIIKYTGNGTAGQTIPHHLGVVPKMIILKPLEAADNWRIYHANMDASAPEDYHMQLNSTAARIDNAGFWNDTAPTSTVFTLGSDSGVGANNQTFIAYCFAEKTGYSKFGSYTGIDGAFIYTGFKPAFILGKNRGGTYDWWIFDNKRDPFNDGANNLLLRANGTDAEATFTYAKVDFLSNGFKIHGTDNTVNANGGTMIYMAFAEAPLVGSNNIPATAR
jgi:hypothetical protein